MSASMPGEKGEPNPSNSPSTMVGGSPEGRPNCTFLTFRSPSMSYNPLPPMIPMSARAV